MRFVKFNTVDHYFNDNGSGCDEIKLRARRKQNILAFGHPSRHFLSWRGGGTKKSMKYNYPIWRRQKPFI